MRAEMCRSQIRHKTHSAGLPMLPELALASPGRGSQLSTRRAEEALQHLPVIDLGGLQTVSSGEMQDLEDHGELDPMLSRVILEYAEKIARPPLPTPPSPSRTVAALQPK